jgi:uncharacterized phage protein (TIGR01671 family)
MKREIKFRAWDESLKIMITPFIDFMHFEASKNCDKMNVLHQNFEEDEDFVPTEIMQFTGLKDRNNKDIYESDIVQFDKPAYPNPYFRGIVEYEIQAGQYWIKWDEGKIHKYRELCYGGQSGSDFITLDNLNIIGNIYQNPDLI